ncbi:hypothetical protein LTR05_007964 [Lithohypha guttulata]|uniref:Uncharacterized protein n=1 Tax=Lithohypha guttulata TaxID=1690604 RepID=A0AAN7Y8J6_9EURO|nr:hypothetical protein LTR05_007964 [Lithohypha guttulata]
MGLPNFVFAPDSQRSLVNDPTFQALCALCLTNNANNDYQLWHNILMYQHYPDPKDFLQIPYFSERIAGSEPGTRFNYNQIRNNLVAVQNDIVGGRETVVRMFAICNELVNAHVQYVQATANVEVFEMYSHMINHFYNINTDSELGNLIVSHSPPHNFQDARCPAYAAISEWITSSLRHWQGLARMTSEEVVQLKDKKQTKWFLAKLEMTMQSRSKKMLEQGAARTWHTPQAAPNSEEANVSPSSSPPRQEQPRNRRELIARHNRLAKQARLISSHRLKTRNLDSIHQLGDTTRIELSDSVIQAISNLQHKWAAEILPQDDEAESEEEYTERKWMEEAMKEKGLVGNASEQICDGISLPHGFVDWNAVQAVHATVASQYWWGSQGDRAMCERYQMPGDV